MAKVGRYVCTLDEASLKTAKEELNEDPRERLGAVDTLRTWVLEQKHLKCPTDTEFLLPFLRARKFSQLEARSRLTNFLTRRSKCSYMFQDCDPAEKGINAVLDDGCLMVLPGRDKQRRKVLVAIVGKIDADFKRYTVVDFFRTCVMCLDAVYFLDETTQVHGTVTLFDFTDDTFKLHRAVEMKQRKDFFHSWEKGYPARIKALNLYRTGPLLDFLLGLMKLIFSGKMQSRIKQHGDNLETVYKEIPMDILPDEYLPDDYEGPSAGSMQQIAQNMKAYFNTPDVASRLRYISSSEHGVNETLVPEDVPQESFRKLNID